MTKLVTRMHGDAAVIPGETEIEWHPLRSDVAAVRAAVKGLASSFELRASEELRWMLASTEPAVEGVLVLRIDGAAATSVGLQIAPVAAKHSLSEAVELVLNVWPFWLVVAGLLFAFGLSRYLAAVIMVVVAAIAVLPVAAVVAALEAARVRRERAWIAEWRGRFLPALAARLNAEQPYR